MWLWATRFFPSRSQATAACRAGKIRLNDVTAKASTPIVIGDRLAWSDRYRSRRVEVVRLLPKRVSATIAVTAYIDHSDPMPTKAEIAAVPQRDRGAGRPEKKDRRELDRLRGFQK